jgi:hypothetical protein
LPPVARQAGSGIQQNSDVGQYSPNAWGFFDMHGNAWEWTADWYRSRYYGSNAVTDPKGSVSGSARVIRGRSWGDAGPYLRSAKRSNNSPSARYYIIGFRVGFQKIQKESHGGGNEKESERSLGSKGWQPKRAKRGKLTSFKIISPLYSPQVANSTLASQNIFEKRLV